MNDTPIASPPTIRPRQTTPNWGVTASIAQDIKKQQPQPRSTGFLGNLAMRGDMIAGPMVAPSAIREPTHEDWVAV